MGLKAKLAGTMVAVAVLSAAATSLALLAARRDGWAASWPFLAVAGASLGLGYALLRHVMDPCVRSVRALTAALKALGQGQPGARVTIPTGDELAALGDAFNQVSDGMAATVARLERQAQVLEQKVEERTRELGQRNREMRLILDHAQQGFLTLSDTGELRVERSTIIDRWFGPFGAGIPYVDYMNQVDPSYAASFAVEFAAIHDDCLPLELCLDQLPTCLRRDGREYRCRYSPFLKGERFDGLMVVIDDVTSELLHARQEADRRELLALVGLLTTDRPGFLAFLAQVQVSLEQVASVDPETQARTLQTLGGNAGQVGLPMVAGLCRQLEGQLGGRSDPLPSESFTPLFDRWRTLESSLRRFLGHPDQPAPSSHARV
jgi:two-component system chemotaxis sensor kinase CheA